MAPQDWLTRDFYDVLGVSRDCGPQALDRAYRGLVRRHHPDLNGGCPRAELRFKEVAAAYAVLSDSRRRAQYDLTWLRVHRSGPGRSPAERPAPDRAAPDRHRPADRPTPRTDPGGHAGLGGWAAACWSPALWSLSVWSSTTRSATRATVDATFWWAPRTPRPPR